MEIRVPRPLPPANQRLMETLGVRVVIDPKAPASCCVDLERQRRKRGSGSH